MTRAEVEVSSPTERLGGALGTAIDAYHFNCTKTFDCPAGLNCVGEKQKRGNTDRLRQ